MSARGKREAGHQGHRGSEAAAAAAGLPPRLLATSQPQPACLSLSPPGSARSSLLLLLPPPASASATLTCLSLPPASLLLPPPARKQESAEETQPAASTSQSEVEERQVRSLSLTRPHWPTTHPPTLLLPAEKERSQASLRVPASPSLTQGGALPATSWRRAHSARLTTESGGDSSRLLRGQQPASASSAGASLCLCLLLLLAHHQKKKAQATSSHQLSLPGSTAEDRVREEEVSPTTTHTKPQPAGV